MWYSIKLQVVIFILYTCLIDINVNELPKPDFVQAQWNLFMLALSILEFVFFNTFNQFTYDFISLLKVMRSQAWNHLLYEGRCGTIFRFCLEFVYFLINLLNDDTNRVEINKFTVTIFRFVQDLWRGIMPDIVPSIRNHLKLFLINSRLMAVIASTGDLTHGVLNHSTMLIVALNPTWKRD